MIKRPLNAGFNQVVLDDIKTTTIRDKAWPVGKPIMLYNWSGAAYRSKQVDVVAVMVEEVHLMVIKNDYPLGMDFSIKYVAGRELYVTEGFATRKALDAWFAKLVKPERTTTKWLMKFRRVH